MRRSLAAALACAALALTGCPQGSSAPVPPTGQGPAPASPGPAPAASPFAAIPPGEEPGPLDPLYDPIKVGEVYVVRMDYGTPLTSRTEIKAKDDDTVTVVTRLEREGTTVVPVEQILRRRKGPIERKTASLPSDETVLRSETLTISGLTYDCKVTESMDAVAGKLTSWKCEKRYPGLVKQVDASGKVVFGLVEVQAPR